MITSAKLLLTAAASLAIGIGGTYLTTVHVTATCEVPRYADVVPSVKPLPPTRDLPLTGWQRY